MQGDFVLVASLNGPVVCRVAEDAGDVVFVSSPEQFDLITKGLPALAPVGFPRKCVFLYVGDRSKLSPKGAQGRPY